MARGGKTGKSNDSHVALIWTMPKRRSIKHRRQQRRRARRQWMSRREFLKVAMAGAVGGVASSITDGILTNIATTWFTTRQRQDRDVSMQGGTGHGTQRGGEPRTVNMSAHVSAGFPRVSATVVVQRRRPDGNREAVANS